MNVNARGTFIGYKAAAKQMIKQGRGGRIIGVYITSVFSTYMNLTPDGVYRCMLRSRKERFAQAFHIDSSSRMSPSYPPILILYPIDSIC